MVALVLDFSYGAEVCRFCSVRQTSLDLFLVATVQVSDERVAFHHLCTIERGFLPRQSYWSIPVLLLLARISFVSCWVTSCFGPIFELFLFSSSSKHPLPSPFAWNIHSFVSWLSSLPLRGLKAGEAMYVGHCVVILRSWESSKA